MSLATRSKGFRRGTRVRSRAPIARSFETLEARALLATANFGNALQFLPPPENVILQGLVQPTAPLGKLASYADLGGSKTGVTIELWVKPTSSGSLVEQPYLARIANSSAFPNLGENFQVPLIWINKDGKVEAGLIDKSSGTISIDARTGVLGVRNTSFPFNVVGVPTVSLTNPLGLRTSSDEPFSTGAPNAIVGQNPVLNNGWHHVALVATPTSESLYVDGQLQGIRTGSFGLTFTASIQGTPVIAVPSGIARLGGTLIPEVAKATAISTNPREQAGVRAYPAPDLHPGINYPRGYSGKIDEVRVWNTDRTASQIQTSMIKPLGHVNRDTLPNLKIVDSFDGALPALHQIVQLQSTIPVDLFPNVARLPGSRPFGLYLATPLETVQLTANVSGGSAFVRKVGLVQGDQIVVSATGQDGNPISSGSFTLSVNASPRDAIAVRSSTVALNAFSPSPVTFTAGESGTYRLTATFANLPVGVTNVNLTYKVLPGGNNQLLDLFGYFKAADGSLVPAYQDPNLPQVSSIDASGFLNRANWPLLTSIVPPAGVVRSSQEELRNAYTSIYNAALPTGGTLGTKYTLMGGFYDIVNSGLISAGDLSRFASDLGSLQASAFPGVTPAAFTTIKSFLLMVTDLRSRALSVLDSYKDFASNVVTTGALQDVPGSIVGSVIASLMQANTNQRPPTLDWPDDQKKGFDILEAFKTTAISITPGILGTASSVILPGSGLLVSGLATLGLEVLGYATDEEQPRPTLITSVDANAYSNINNVAARVQSDLAKTRGNLVASFDDPTFRQVVMSNYGLLQLLMNVPSVPFSKADYAKSSQTLETAIRYASWKQIVGAAYHWEVDVPKTTDNASFPTYTATSSPFARFVAFNGKSIAYYPEGLGGQLVALQGGKRLQQTTTSFVSAGDIKVTWNPRAPRTTYNQATRRNFTTGLFGSALNPPIPTNFVGVPLNATTQGRGSRFYTLAEVNFHESSQRNYSSDGEGNPTRTINYQRDGALGIAWVLRDSNGLEMAPDIAQQVFGVGANPVNLVSTGTARYISGGAYFPVQPVPGAVTSWSDAFFQWDVPTVGAVKGSLVPSAQVSGTFASPNGPNGDRVNSQNPSANVNYSITFRPMRPLVTG